MLGPKAQVYLGGSRNVRATCSKHALDAESYHKLKDPTYVPHITYSVRKCDVKAEDALVLLQSAFTEDLAGRSRVRAHHFAYWRDSSNEVQVKKMAKALNHSLVVVAAFSNADPDSDEEPAESESLWIPPWPSLPSSLSRPLPPPLLPLMKRSRTLVGLARATGDAALTATLFDVAVHPRLQRRGIGQRLVKTVVQQLLTLGIYDIGMVGPPELDTFFSRCSFGEDSQQSTFMSYKRTPLPIIKSGKADMGSSINQTHSKASRHSLSDMSDSLSIVMSAAGTFNSVPTMPSFQNLSNVSQHSLTELSAAVSSRTSSTPHTTSSSSSSSSSKDGGVPGKEPAP
ncbi:hypothetical protein CEUSTIGMA_g14037.t1, partial [Chlamydomonas eustigma]